MTEPIYTITQDGLTAECRIIRVHKSDKNMVRVETALGEHWVFTADLHIKKETVK